MALDLKLDKNLLDYKFEGYKISLDPIPVVKQSLCGGVESFDLEEDEYAYQQVRMSVLFNQLFQDPWCPSCVFFVSQRRCIYWSSLSQDGRLSAPHLVWQLSIESASSKANVTVIFPGADWVVASNGKGIIYLLHTPSRAAGEPWTVCHTYSVPDCHSSCFLLHGIHLTLPGRQQIDCLLAYFSRDPDKKYDSKAPSLIHVLEWMSFICGQNIQDWCLKRIRKLTSDSAIKYAALEASGDALCVVSEADVKIVFDSEKGTECTANNGEKKAGESEKEPPLYTYIQTAEDITVVFRLPKETKKSDIQISFKPTVLEVILRGKPVLSGRLWNCIETDSCTWIINEQRLELILSKTEIGLMWQELIKGDKRGEEIMDPALVEEIHSKLAHLTSEDEVVPSDMPQFNLDQLEECDACPSFLTFLRIDGNSHEETHRINMGGHQWLFSSQLCPESLPIICLRHDVDGIIWQPKNVSSEGELESFKMEHIATFSALGYVQASKQDKKFILCSPDFTFAVILDYNRHVYIYSQPEHLHSTLQLRNRKTGESISHIAKQYVINLEQCKEIVGACVCKECIFVLSSDILYAINIARK